MGTNAITTQIRIDADAAIKALKNVEAGFDGTESSAQRAAAQINAMADLIEANLRESEGAVNALSNALGSEFVGDLERAGGSVDALVADLRAAGVQFNDIEAEADQLAAALKRAESAGRQMGDGVRVSSRGAGDGLAHVAREGDNSRSVLANMVGNSSQDIAALGGVSGTAGVAIGQLAEYAADGNISLQGLATAGLAMGGVATVLWAVNYAAEAQKARIDAITESIRNLSTATDEGVLGAFYDSLANTLFSGGSLQDLINQMAEENLPGLKRTLDLAAESGRFGADTLDMMADAIAEAERAADQGAATNEKYGDSVRSAAAATRGWNAANAEVVTDLDNTSRAALNAAAAAVMYQANLGNIPDEVMTELRAAINRGDINAIWAILGQLAVGIDVPVRIITTTVGQTSVGNVAAGSKSLAGRFAPKVKVGGGGGGGGSSGGGGGGGGGGKTPEQEAKEAADAWDEAMARAYAYGEISREEYRKYLEGQMADEDKYSDEYYKHWQERQRLDKEEADAKKKAADEEKKALDEREKADKEQAKRDEEKIQRQQEIAAMFEAARSAAAETFNNGPRSITIYTAGGGEEVVQAIKAYERNNGTGWRS